MGICSSAPGAPHPDDDFEFDGPDGKQDNVNQQDLSESYSNSQYSDDEEESRYSDDESEVEREEHDDDESMDDFDEESVTQSVSPSQVSPHSSIRSSVPAFSDNVSNPSSSAGSDGGESLVGERIVPADNETQENAKAYENLFAQAANGDNSVSLTPAAAAKGEETLIQKRARELASQKINLRVDQTTDKLAQEPGGALAIADKFKSVRDVVMNPRISVIKPNRMAAEGEDEALMKFNQEEGETLNKEGTVTERMARIAAAAGGGAYSPGFATAHLGPAIIKGFEEKRKSLRPTSMAVAPKPAPVVTAVAPSGPRPTATKPAPVATFVPNGSESSAADMRKSLRPVTQRAAAPTPAASIPQPEGSPKSSLRPVSLRPVQQTSTKTITASAETSGQLKVPKLQPVSMRVVEKKQDPVTSPKKAPWQRDPDDENENSARGLLKPVNNSPAKGEEKPARRDQGRDGPKREHRKSRRGRHGRSRTPGGAKGSEGARSGEAKGSEGARPGEAKGSEGARQGGHGKENRRRPSKGKPRRRSEKARRDGRGNQRQHRRSKSEKSPRSKSPDNVSGARTEGYVRPEVIPTAPVVQAPNQRASLKAVKRGVVKSMALPFRGSTVLTVPKPDGNIVVYSGQKPSEPSSKSNTWQSTSSTSKSDTQKSTSSQVSSLVAAFTRVSESVVLEKKEVEKHLRMNDAPAPPSPAKVDTKSNNFASKAKKKFSWRKSRGGGRAIGAPARANGGSSPYGVTKSGGVSTRRAPGKKEGGRRGISSLKHKWEHKSSGGRRFGGSIRIRSGKHQHKKLVRRTSSFDASLLSRPGEKVVDSRSREKGKREKIVDVRSRDFKVDKFL